MPILWMLLTIALLLFAHFIIRDYASPAFISGVIWVAVYIILFLNREYIPSGISCYYFFVAYTFFLAGFFIPMRKINLRRIKSVQSLQLSVEWTSIFGKVIILLEYLFSVTILKTTLTNLIQLEKSIWQMFRETASQEASLSSFFVGVMLNAVQVVFLIAYAVYLLNPTKRNRRMMLVALPPVVLTLLYLSRGGWFLILISCVFLYIYIKRPKDRKIALIGIAGVSAILLVFFVSSFDKYSDVNKYQSDIEMISGLTGSYFVAPPVLFLQWISSDYHLENGKYIFRFVCALLHDIFPEIEVVDTVQEFSNYGGGISNVYTALHWYSIDFGFFGACIVEFILGYIYGRLYKQVRMSHRTSIIVLILLSMLLVPLVIQFFYETFLAIFSLWIQRIFWLLLIIKSPAIQYTKISQNNST